MKYTKASKGIKLTVDDINSPVSTVAHLEHDIIALCQGYLIDRGVIPPLNDIDESIKYSVSQLCDTLQAYQNVISILEDITKMQLENAHEIEVVMTAKFGIVTKGHGFRLNRQLLRAMMINGQGEVDIT